MTLGLGFFVLGVASGFGDVAINVQAAEVEQRHGRPILVGLHGLWSVGLFAGTGVAAAAVDSPVIVHFALAGLAVAGMAAVLGRRRRSPSGETVGQDAEEAGVEAVPQPSR